MESGEANKAPGVGDCRPTSRGCRTAVLVMVLLTQCCVNVLTASMVPFLPDFAAETFGASSTVVGVIFAAYPLSLFLASLCMGLVCQS